uniref:Uncharacterized protein n=1 Tax=Amphimedon queenslandica TaxID=400682 RepID=A0A1X7V7X6_AMPQE
KIPIFNYNPYSQENSDETVELGIVTFIVCDYRASFFTSPFILAISLNKF